MPDFFLNLLCVCGSTASVALTVALLKAVYDYVRGDFAFFPPPSASDDKPVCPPVAPTALYEPPVRQHVLLDPGQQKNQPVPLAAILERALRTEPVLPSQVHGIEATFPPPAVPVTPRAAEEFDLECGNCHNPIKSSPINVDSKGQGRSERRYRCESCGAIVAVKS